MSHKHRHTPSSKRANDLRLINGIGPVLARRLKLAGIRSFAQLAASSPAQIAKLIAGVSATQVLRCGWIEQANKLAQAFDESASETIRTTIRPPQRRTRADNRKTSHRHHAATEQIDINTSHQHYATFTVQLLLNDDDSIRRMRAVHVQSGAELIYAGWDEARLITFMIQHIKLHLLTE